MVTREAGGNSRQKNPKKTTRGSHNSCRQYRQNLITVVDSSLNCTHLSPGSCYDQIPLVITGAYWILTAVYWERLIFLYPTHDSGGGIMFSCWSSVCPSICLSVSQSYIRLYYLFWDDNLSKCQWIFIKLDIVEIGLGLLMGKFGKFLTELSA